mmetsp:Transcript_126/g.234  ORF Transcript_126/g.234 Transcript_126/m.234 type:complete len:427 (+) Transcript_126:96-1376(+)|eukprot:g9486.t1
MLSLKAVARFHYVSLWATAAACYLAPAWAQSNMGALFGLDLSSPIVGVLLKAHCAVLVYFGALFAAVAQFESEVAKKKALQYGMGAECTLVGVLFWKGKNFLPDNLLYAALAACFVGILVTSLSVYHFNKFVGKPDPADSTSQSVTKALRSEYTQLFVIALMFLSCPVVDEFIPGLPKGPGLDLYICARGAITIGQSMLMMGIARCDPDSQKLTLQYAMVARLGDWFYTTSLLAPVLLSNKGSGERNVQLFLAYQILNTLYMIHACYPANGRKWLLRFSYLLYAYVAYLLLAFPKLGSLLFQLPEVGSAADILGFAFALLALLFAAAAQFDFDSQTVVLKYASFLYFGVVAMSYPYLGLKYNFGRLSYVAFFFLVGGFADWYVENNSSTFAAILAKLTPMKGTAKSKGASSKKSSRNRSKTPGKKK